MNKKPAAWDNSKGKKHPDIWNVSDNNSVPDKWKKTKTDRPPEAWGGKADVPDNWGRSSKCSVGRKASEGSAAFENAKESVSDFSRIAKDGAGMFSGAARKFGDKAKNATESAARYANSDKTAQKLDLAKGKAGAAFAGLKKQAGGFARNVKSRSEGDAASEEQPYEDAVNIDDMEASEYEEVYTEASDPEEAAENEHDRAIDDMISTALSAGNETEESEDAPLADKIRTRAEKAPAHGMTDSKSTQYARRNVRQEPVRPKYADDYTPPVYKGEAAVVLKPEKKDGTTKVIICIIIVFVAFVIIFNSIVFTLRQNKPKKKENSLSSVTVASEENTEADSDTTDTAESVSTTAAASGEATTAATTKAPVVRVDTTAAVKRAITSHFDKKYADEKKDSFNVMDREAKYALYDVDEDGVDELFIAYLNAMIGGSQTDIYLYSNGDYTLAKEIFDGGASVSLSDHFIMTEQHGGGRSTRIFNIADGKLIQADELVSDGAGYKHNGASISQSEYDQIFSQYESKHLKYIYDTGIYCTGLVDISQYKKVKDYSVFDASDAPRDFDFYPSTKAATVNVTSGGLNLRATPAYDGEIITLMPDDAAVTDYGSNNQWAYVRYISSSATYYGYASKAYLNYHENVTVYPCTRYGHIKLSSGQLRGFKRSYVVDGGTLEECDISLQNGWHIKAVNYCSSKGITWYELYDADDGDYYGWIDSDFITFDS